MKYFKILLPFFFPVIVVLLSSLLNRASTTTPHRSYQQPENTDSVQYQHKFFSTAANCMSCHNGMMSQSGKDVSIGTDWRATMMANSARDPYWHAAVRREVMDHPSAKAEIEDECSTCHMPMAHTRSNMQGKHGEVFSHLPAGKAATQKDMLAVDGVSCTTCHQITSENFGKRESFVGQFGIDSTSPMGQRNIYGPYHVDTGQTRIMHSSSGFRQKQSAHIQESELCAPCHTLYTKSLGPEGNVIGELPEQVPYLEWRHSAFKDEQSCQSCHMPELEKPTPIASTSSQPRPNFSQHSFRGGNFFMLRILNRYRDELGVKALPQEMNESINRTENFLEDASARITINDFSVRRDTLRASINIRNLAGHKLPTAYPSRRVWLHIKATTPQGETVFESGAVNADGSIAGNDNDRSPEQYEPHHKTIRGEDQVQIYEAIMVGPDDQVTTGLLSAVRFIKDNRLLPKGFNKTTADEDIAVQGTAYQDEDFRGGRDQVKLEIPLSVSEDSLKLTAELHYQPIAYRWAQNLDSYESSETNRFTGYYNSMSEVSSRQLTQDQITLE